MAGEFDDRKIEIIHWVVVDYPDDMLPLDVRLTNLLREYCNWMEEIGSQHLGVDGNIGLPSGSVKWRRIP
jgi:hypothetical protein